MTDTPETSPEKPKKKIITVGEDRLSKIDSGSERRGGKGRGGKGRGRDESDRRPAVPPALMRGPKPKPKAEETPEEVTIEAAVEEATSPVDEESAPEVSEPEAEAALP